MIKQANDTTKNPSFGKVIVQWMITAVLLLFIGCMAIYSIELIAGALSDDEYKWLLDDLNDGDYANCVEAYIVSEHLGQIKDEKFEQFDEFELFYREYILCLEYQAAVEPERYGDRLDESIARMEEICENSSYEFNVPHYEALIENIKVGTRDNQQ